MKATFRMPSDAAMLVSPAKSVAHIYVCFGGRTPNCHSFDLQLPIPSNPAGQLADQSQLMLFLSANQKQRSLLSTNKSAAGSHSTLKLRENKEVGGTERERGVGASGEDAADDGSGAWLPGRPLPRRHRRDRPPNPQRKEQPRQQQNGKRDEWKKKNKNLNSKLGGKSDF